MDMDGWFYEVAGERKGPVPFDELRRLIQAGVVKRETNVWAQGLANPVPAGQMAVLFPRGPDAWMRWLLPVGRSGYAIAAGYLALFSFIPFFGLFAILFAGLGIWDLRKHREKSGWGRVSFALLLSVPLTLMGLLIVIR